MPDRQIDPHHHPELLDADVFVADNATLLGQVRVGTKTSIWFGAVVRGDTEAIEIGQESNIQDLAVLHADPGYPCHVGNRVTIGHAAIVHGATIHDGALIGMRAVIMNGAVVGAGAIVGAGSVVPEGKEIPPGHLAVGTPARVIRELSDTEVQRLTHTADHYVQSAAVYRQASPH